jgi:hypothetical protein
VAGLIFEKALPPWTAESTGAITSRREGVFFVTRREQPDSPEGNQMNGFWVTFEDGTAGYCETPKGSPDEAWRIAEKLTGKGVQKVAELPYPADPVIWQFDHPLHGKIPTFCYSPRDCQGKSACPKRYACTN